MSRPLRGGRENHYGLFQVLRVGPLTTTVPVDLSEEELATLIEKYERWINCGPVEPTKKNEKGKAA